MKFPIPDAALDKHIAFLGGTGSGKTSGAKSGIVERALDAGERVLVIDPTSAWWGLRLGRDGKSKGFPIYIFGGDHGDYPLRARDAGTLADAFATATDSAIFDTSLMTVTERTQFFTEFAEAIRRKNRGPLKVVIDEAHLFMPQAGAKVGGGVPNMLHAGNNLVSLGRSRGLRITLISQRPAKLHKDSLTQVQTLVAMRLMAPQDRKAVADWIEDQADASKGKEIIASLPNLKPGEAWVWAPLANSLERVQFPIPRTFDSSRAPDIADGKGPSLAPINMDALKGRLATVEAETKANDPKALKAEVARLTRELAAKPQPFAPVEKINTAALEAAAFAQGWEACWPKAYIAGHLRGIKGTINGIREVTDAIVKEGPQSHVPPAPPPPKKAPTANNLPRNITENITASLTSPVHRAPSVPRTPAASNGHDHLSAPQRRVLASLGFWKSIGHDAPTRPQVAAVAGYSPSSGGFNNLIGGLNTAGLIAIPMQGRVALATDYGALSPDEAREKMLDVLSGPQRKLVDAALQSTDAISRDALGEATGYSASSGGFNNLIGSLSTLGIFTKPVPGHVALSDWAREVLV